MRAAIYLAAALSVVLVGCDKGKEAPSSSSPPATAAAVGKVDVPAEGKKFDPPIKPDQLPEGSWYCDMGTVHYACKKEGSCPICQMKLKQKK